MEAHVKIIMISLLVIIMLGVSIAGAELIIGGEVTPIKPLVDVKKIIAVKQISSTDLDYIGLKAPTEDNNSNKKNMVTYEEKRTNNEYCYAHYLEGVIDFHNCFNINGLSDADINKKVQEKYEELIQQHIIPWSKEKQAEPINQNTCLQWDIYPTINCLEIDKKTGLCIKYEQPKECIEFDTKIGACNKWSYELQCLKWSDTKEIAEPIIDETPKDKGLIENIVDGITSLFK